MKTPRILTLAAAIVALAITQSVQAQVIQLGEQAITFKLKLTTLKPPAVQTGSASFSVKLNTYVGTMTTKDVLKTLGFPSNAKLVVRLYADTGYEPARITARFIVKSNGAEYDYTSMLQDIVPFVNPIDLLYDGAGIAGSQYASGVVSGNAKADIFSGLHASLKGLAYSQSSANIGDVQVGSVQVGNVAINGAGVSKATAIINGGLFSGVTMNLSTCSQVAGGATISNAPLLGYATIPAVVEGTVSTKGVCHVGTIDLISFFGIWNLLDLID